MTRRTAACSSSRRLFSPSSSWWYFTRPPWRHRLRRAAPVSATALAAFSAAAVGAGLGRALLTTYLPVLLERIRDAPGLIGVVMLVNTPAGFVVPV